MTGYGVGTEEASQPAISRRQKKTKTRVYIGVS